MKPEALELLDKPLEASRVKTREAGGNRPKLAYLETHDVIRTANLIFGFGQWGHEIIELRPIPGVSFTSNGKTGLHLGYVCIVRLTVEGCVPTSGIGYGDATEYRDVAPVTAHELAAKEAESDALKRALKNYGDQFGLALYSKDAASAGHIASNGSSSGTPAPGRQGAPEPSPGNGAPAFPTEEFRFASGKYQGKTFAEVPRDYAVWCAENHPKPEVQEVAKVWLGLTSPALADDIPF